jgi:hypothetical protein
LKGASLKEKLILLLIIAIIAPTAEYLILPSITTSSGPTLAVTKIYNKSLQEGQSIIVNLTVSGVSDLIAYSVNLAFNPSVLQVTTGNPKGVKDPQTGIKYDIYEGPFLRLSTTDTMFLINGVDNKHGNISALVQAIIPAGDSSSGSGVLALINFTCVNPTTYTAINITGTSTLETDTSFSIPHKAIDGFITSGAAPGVWTELWFQAILIVVVIEILVVVLGIFITIRWWRSERKAETEDEAVLEDLAR